MQVLGGSNVDASAVPSPDALDSNECVVIRLQHASKNSKRRKREMWSVSGVRGLARACRRWCEFAAPLAARAPCVIFDVDGTLLDGAAPIREMVDLAAWCASRGIAVVVVTARLRRHQRETERQLGEVGVRASKGYFCEAALSSFAEVARYKRACRERVARRHTVLASVGDQWSDFGTAAQLRGVPRDPGAEGVLCLPHATWLAVKLPRRDQKSV